MSISKRRRYKLCHKIFDFILYFHLALAKKVIRTTRIVADHAWTIRSKAFSETSTHRLKFRYQRKKPGTTYILFPFLSKT